MSRDDPNDLTPDQVQLAEPFLDGLKDAFYAMQDVTMRFQQACIDHDLNIVCSYSYFKQMRDDAERTVAHANGMIDSIARTLGTTRDALDAREYWQARRVGFVDSVDRMTADGSLEAADAAAIRKLMGF